MQKSKHTGRGADVSATSEGFWTWKRRLLVSHFVDTLILLILEMLLAVSLNLSNRYMLLPPGLVDWVDLITKWSCISTLMLFGSNLEFCIWSVASLILERLHK